MYQLNIRNYFDDRDLIGDSAGMIILKAHACGESYHRFIHILSQPDVLEKFDCEYINTIQAAVTKMQQPLEYVKNPNERLIIEKEILEGCNGKWYLEFFSESTYRRNLPRACEDFIRYIEYA